MIAQPIVGSSIYKEVTLETLELIKQRIMEGRPSFLSAVTPIFAETVQVAYLLNKLYNQGSSSQKRIYKSFFANSNIEALHGAIKIARHSSSVLKPSAKGQVLIYSPDNDLKTLFDPKNQGEKKALIPNIYFDRNIDSVINKVEDESNDWAALIISIDKKTTPDLINQLFASCKRKNIISIIYTPINFEYAVSIIRTIEQKSDIIVAGEELTQFQIPFGAFSVADEVYQEWNKISTCMLHVSTYGGNGLVLSFVKNYLLQAKRFFQFDYKDINELEGFRKSQKKKIQGFKKYINSSSPILYNSGKLDINLVAGSGTKLKVKNSFGRIREILDCLGGGGCSLRGHNSKDIIVEVLDTHDNNRNYWNDLSEKLLELTGFPQCFPGVSGASAVEIAITLAMVANKGKNKIIIFKGNYAGTSLIALNASDRNNSPFHPLYPEVTSINIYDPRSKEALEKLLSTGEVALVWFEAIQGSSLFSIPYEILRLINDYKESKGFFVGIDEILNGTFRTGKFFSFDEKVISPDIVTISKAISDMLFPVSVALVSEKVYHKAFLSNPALLLKYQDMYKNQFGAHIALHALEKAVATSIPENVRRMSKALKTGLKDISKKSSLLKSVGGVGLHLQLNLALDQFPFTYFGKYWSEVVMSKLCYQNKVLTLYGRLLPPLNISTQEVNDVIKGIDKAFNTPRILILRIGLWQKFKMYIYTKTNSISDFMDNL